MRNATLPLLLATLLAAPLVGEELQNSDIVKMVKAGLAESLILEKIEQSTAGFDTKVDALILLQQQGVPDAIIQAMLRRKSTNRTEDPPATKKHKTCADLLRVLVPEETDDSCVQGFTQWWGGSGLKAVDPTEYVPGKKWPTFAAKLCVTRIGLKSVALPYEKSNADIATFWKTSWEDLQLVCLASNPLGTLLQFHTTAQVHYLGVTEKPRRENGAAVLQSLKMLEEVCQRANLPQPFEILYRCPG